MIKKSDFYPMPKGGKTILFIISFLLLNLFISAQPDTIYQVSTVYPFQIEQPQPVNFPLQFAEPVGDVNGDGLCDFSFYRYTWNEQTDELTDKLWKSVIVTDIQDPKSAFVFYNAEIKGIGDYNGDGYDDLLDIKNGIVFFGNATGKDFDSLTVDLPDRADKYYFHGDINNDGKPEFLVGDEDHEDTLFVFSYGSPQKYIVVDLSVYNALPLKFHVYDYDHDGENELLIVSYCWGNYNYGWYDYDETEEVYKKERTGSTVSLSDPSRHYPGALADINGDGVVDICQVYFHEGKYNIEAYFGTDSQPYRFGNRVGIELNNNSRMLYYAGDFNGDGAGDWYAKTSVDTVTLYYGNPAVDTGGFDTEKYFTGDENLILLPGLYYGIYELARQPLIFDYNYDSINDLTFSYWHFDDHKLYDTIGTAIVTGSADPGFVSPEVLGTPAGEAFESITFGNKVKNAGDFNKDGYEDWAILSMDGCFVNIYFGGPVLDFEPDKTIFLPQYPYSRCFDMAFGDLNADGWTDVAVSNSSVTEIGFTRNFMEENENVYIFTGSPYMPDVLYWDNASVILEDTGRFYSFGKNLAIPGDYNADGYNDLVVGGGKHKYCLREAFVYFGGEQVSSDYDILISVPCNECGIAFASPITVCGDINDDGYRDFTFGDPSNGPGQSLVYLSGPFADSLYDIAIVNPVLGGRQFGSGTPTTEGDFDHDGYPDLIQWDYNDETIYVYRGGPDFDDEPDIILSDTSLDVFMSCVEFIPDFSEKGRADLLIADSYPVGNPLLFYGTGEGKEGADVVFKNNLMSARSAASGDFDNDGYVDIIIGNPYAPVKGWVSGGVCQHYVSPVLVGREENIARNNALLKVSPNPFISEITINLSAPRNEKMEIRISSVTGKAIFKTTAVTNRNITLNLHDLPDGLYIVNVLSKSVSESRKILKSSDRL